MFLPKPVKYARKLQFYAEGGLHASGIDQRLSFRMNATSGLNDRPFLANTVDPGWEGTVVYDDVIVITEYYHSNQRAQ